MKKFLVGFFVTVLLSLGLFFTNNTFSSFDSKNGEKVAEKVFKRLENKLSSNSDIEKSIYYNYLINKLDDIVVDIKNPELKQIIYLLIDKIEYASENIEVKNKNTEKRKEYPKTNDPSGISLEELKDMGKIFINSIENRIYYKKCDKGEEKTLYYKGSKETRKIKFLCDKRVGRFYIPLGEEEPTFTGLIYPNSLYLDKSLDKNSRVFMHPTFKYNYESVSIPGTYEKFSATYEHRKSIKYFGNCNKKGTKKFWISRPTMGFVANYGTFFCDTKVGKYVRMEAGNFVNWFIDDEIHSYNDFGYEEAKVFSKIQFSPVNKYEYFSTKKIKFKELPISGKSIYYNANIKNGTNFGDINYNPYIISNKNRLTSFSVDSNDLQFCISIIEHPIKKWVIGDDCEKGEGYKKVEGKKISLAYLRSTYSKKNGGADSWNGIGNIKQFIPGTRIKIYIRNGGKKSKDIVSFPISIVKLKREKQIGVEGPKDSFIELGTTKELNKSKFYKRKDRTKKKGEDSSKEGNSENSDDRIKEPNENERFGSCKKGGRKYYKVSTGCFGAGFECIDGQYKWSRLQFSPGPTKFPKIGDYIFESEEECYKKDGLKVSNKNLKISVSKKENANFTVKNIEKNNLEVCLHTNKHIDPNLKIGLDKCKEGKGFKSWTLQKGFNYTESKGYWEIKIPFRKELFGTKGGIEVFIYLRDKSNNKDLEKINFITID